jgi:hypothetical protein
MPTGSIEQVQKEKKRMSQSDMLAISRQWWEELNQIQDVKEYLRIRDQDVQFHLADDTPFYVRFLKGRVSVEEGVVPPDIFRVLNLETTREALLQIYRGRKSFAESVIEEKIFAHEMSKRSTITWVGKIIRLRKELGSPLLIR